MAWENRERKERCDVGDVGLGSRGRHRGKKPTASFEDWLGHCMRVNADRSVTMCGWYGGKIWWMTPE